MSKRGKEARGQRGTGTSSSPDSRIEISLATISGVGTTNGVASVVVWCGPGVSGVWRLASMAWRAAGGG